MGFQHLFEGKSWPVVGERIGVMSVDSLNRQWVFVRNDQGYLIAKSKDGKAALLGRMCERDDGKFCVEIVVRAEIQNNRLCQPEFFHVNQGEELGFTRQLANGLQDGQIG